MFDFKALLKAAGLAATGLLLAPAPAFAGKDDRTREITFHNATGENIKICPNDKTGLRGCSRIGIGGKTTIAFAPNNATVIRVFRPKLLDELICKFERRKGLQAISILEVTGDDRCIIRPQWALDQIRTRGIRGGDEVWGRWSDGRWYPGKVVRRIDKRFDVAFLDGDRAILEAGQVYDFKIDNGSRVEVRGAPSGFEGAMVLDRFADAVWVRAIDGRQLAVTVDQLWSLDTPSVARNVLKGRPAVLANVCNRTNSEVRFAQAIETANEGQAGHAAQGWKTVPAGSCIVANLSRMWQSERGPEQAETKAPTYIYAQTEEAFDSRGQAVIFAGAGGKTWAGGSGDKRFCIGNTLNVSFRHVLDRSKGLDSAQYCKSAGAKQVAFRKLDLSRIDWTKGGVVSINFE